jgi:hypothetical protein
VNQRAPTAWHRAGFRRFLCAHRVVGTPSLRVALSAVLAESSASAALECSVLAAV